MNSSADSNFYGWFSTQTPELTIGYTLNDNWQNFI
jgi:hypothetical protein